MITLNNPVQHQDHMKLNKQMWSLKYVYKRSIEIYQ